LTLLVFILFNLLVPVIIVSEGPVDCRIIVYHVNRNGVGRVISPIRRSLTVDEGQKESQTKEVQNFMTH